MIRVVKVGGSLFDYDELVEQLDQWLAVQSPAAYVMVAGGGSLADVIRMADGRFCIGEETAHWLAIETLGVTARLLQALLPSSVLVQQLDQWVASAAAGAEPPLAILEPRHFMREVEPRLTGCVLPHTWQVTSDSIAARVAQALEADELVLLKSGLPPPHATFDAAAAEGYVDTFFPLAAQELPVVRCVDFRSKSCSDVVLQK